MVLAALAEALAYVCAGLAGDAQWRRLRTCCTPLCACCPRSFCASLERPNDDEERAALAQPEQGTSYGAVREQPRAWSSVAALRSL
ncbi:hypothetical protein FA09DRAFT_337665 [Tilletiopsis washingtonensis]|uniref:Secreted protein n=1 Tax=Tilletiopsis washingtonensis TaxID=58919 RepID=A0A316ZGU9_9BASI|nr:hypothetical protein FA09DRAFT_337665 [Tilletiopsis washingtonensis]PWN99545.1 hypothetical protein FA09DRAFT_337665 [Tilletiopsis washingtonensis]